MSPSTPAIFYDRFSRSQCLSPLSRHRDGLEALAMMTSQSPGFVFRYSESFVAMPTCNAPERICWNLSKDYSPFQKIIRHFKRLLPISKDYLSVIAVPDADFCRNREIWNDMQFPFALKRKATFLAHCMAVSPPFFRFGLANPVPEIADCSG